MPRTNYCKPSSTIALEKLSRWVKRQAKQKEIAEVLGISKQLMSYKLKHNVLTAEDLLKIFHYLETDTDEILKVMTYKN